MKSNGHLQASLQTTGKMRFALRYIYSSPIYKIGSNSFCNTRTHASLYICIQAHTECFFILREFDVPECRAHFSHRSLFTIYFLSLSSFLYYLSFSLFSPFSVSSYYTRLGNFSFFSVLMIYVISCGFIFFQRTI